MTTKLKHVCLITWRKRLENAKKRGYFTMKEEAMASNWNACAVGEAHKLNNVIIHCIGKEPLDFKLRKFGYDFSCAVELASRDCTLHAPTKAFKLVESILNKIEKRLVVLYKEAHI